jgi:deferrochelatase/peroxidase EfeB
MTEPSPPDEATTEPASDTTAQREGRTSRRGFVGAAIGVAGLAVVGGAGYGVARATDGSDSGSTGSGGTSRVPFYGAKQAGIATPAQDRLAFAAFDVTSFDVEDIKAMLGTWAAAASLMTVGLPIGPVNVAPQAPPVDTGEALGLSPANLTITVGFGPSMFDDRFGLASKRPSALADLPALPRDALDPAITGGDIGVQACSDDPVVAFHVIRNFARLARGTAVMRWSQLGFGRTSSTSTTQETPRNLMGFKDGTNNIKSEDLAELDDYVWVGAETDQPWMRGGSYMVTRRIAMHIESWDTDFLADQQNVFGRFKTSGAPLTGKHEFDRVDLQARGADGKPVISLNAHIRLAAPATNNGQMILRRGYSFTDGIDADTGLLDAGLFFIAYQKDPRKQFVVIQRKLGDRDNLNEYIQHTGSGLFAVPPGISGPGDWFGKSLFT